MRQIRLFEFFLIAALVLLTGCTASTTVEPESAPTASPEDSAGWVDLFNGTSLDGWTASENVETFKIENGAIVAHGPRSHLFYSGPIADHDFGDFEFRAEIMTTPGSNSGMYFHTEFQQEGWPAKGYEAQINNSGSDPRKTGSLYAIQDVTEPLVNDSEWFTQHVIVSGKRIVIEVNGEKVVDYTEPENPARSDDMAQRLLSSGTVALQGHDPESRVLFRKIQVKLPSP